MDSASPKITTEGTTRTFFQLSITKEKVIQLIPLITTALILLGFFNIYSYYALFGIDIVSYLNPSEILLSFSSLFLSVVYLVVLITLNSVLQGIYEEAEDYSRNKSLSRRMLIGIVRTLITTFLVIGVLTILKHEALKNIYDLIYIGVVLIICWISFKIKNKNVVAAIIFVTAVTFIQLRNTSEFREITINKSPKYNVEFKGHDYHLKTTKDFFYIGSTHDYLFFWDDFSKNVMTYPTTNIEWISTKENRKAFIEY